MSDVSPARLRLIADDMRAEYGLTGLRLRLHEYADRIEELEAAVSPSEPAGGVERALQGALDYLRNIDHDLLDRHYEEQSWYLQCRPLIEALAVVHALADADAGFGAAWDDIRDRVLTPTERVIDHFTSGAPTFRLAMEEGDPGWAVPVSQEVEPCGAVWPSVDDHEPHRCFRGRGHPHGHVCPCGHVLEADDPNVTPATPDPVAVPPEEPTDVVGVGHHPGTLSPAGLRALARVGADVGYDMLYATEVLRAAAARIEELEAERDDWEMAYENDVAIAATVSLPEEPAEPDRSPNMPSERRIRPLHYAEASECIGALADRMLANSERWFPDLHADPEVPLSVFYAMGLCGEAGEVIDAIKKSVRRRGNGKTEHVAEELADTFVYLVLLADELGVDLVRAYLDKAEVCEARWGDNPSLPVAQEPPNAE